MDNICQTKTDNNKKKLDDLKVLRRSPDHFNNVKIGQGQLQLTINKVKNFSKV